MLRYENLTKADLPSSGCVKPIDSADPFNPASLSYFANYPDDEVVAVAAIERSQVVGRIFLAYSDVEAGGQLVRLSVGGNLYVLPDYRKKAVGVKLLWHTMRLGNPYIAASVSPELFRILNASPQFYRIDASPVFVIGANLAGTFRTARLAAQNLAPVNVATTKLQIKMLGEKLLERYALARPYTNRLHTVPATEAFDMLVALSSARGPARTHIPWNRDKMRRALAGAEVRHHAWIVRPKHSKACQFLVTMYLEQREIALFRTRDVRSATVARVAEVYPAPESEEDALALVGFALEKARSFHSTMLFIYALDRRLAEACRKLKLQHFIDKRIFVGSNLPRAANPASIVDPGCWWCRAVNENQFEEAYQPRQASRSLCESPNLL